MYRGVIVPLVTPVTRAGQVCQSDVASLIRTVRPHVAALLPALSTGEGWALTAGQWRDMLRYTVRHAGGLPVLAGIQYAATEQMVARTAVAAQLGARAVVVPKPVGAGLAQEQMFQHYKEVCARTALPVVVYNESAVSRNSADLATLLRICALPGVTAVKESSGDARFTRLLVDACPAAAVWQGWEHLVAVSGPVDGFVLALANVAPELCAAMFHTPSPFAADELARACREHGLAEPDWYLHIKTLLYRRNVIANREAVTGPGRASSPAREAITCHTAQHGGRDGNQH